MTTSARLIQFKRKRLYGFDILFWGPFLYIILLPLVFAVFPQATEAWLNVCDLIFGHIPRIFPFLRNIDIYITESSYVLPLSYYVHSFWVLFINFLALCLYIRLNFRDLFFERIVSRKHEPRFTFRKLTIGRPSVRTYGVGANTFGFIGIAGLSIYSVFVLIFGLHLDLLFDTAPSAGRFSPLDTWLGRQVRPVFFIWIFLILPTSIFPYLVAVTYRHFLTFNQQLRFRRRFRN